MPKMLGRVELNYTICSMHVLFRGHIIYIWCYDAACCAMLTRALHMTARLSMPDQALSCQTAGRAMRHALQVPRCVQPSRPVSDVSTLVTNLRI